MNNIEWGGGLGGWFVGFLLIMREERQGSKGVIRLMMLIINVGSVLCDWLIVIDFYNYIYYDWCMIIETNYFYSRT